MNADKKQVKVTVGDFLVLKHDVGYMRGNEPLRVAAIKHGEVWLQSTQGMSSVPAKALRNAVQSVLHK